MVKEVNLDNLGVVADTFHMNIEEEEPIYKSILKCGGYLIHVHVADNNRKAPGMGHLPFRRFFKALKQMRYEKFISIEVIIPLLPDFETVAEKINKIFTKYNVGP